MSYPWHLQKKKKKQNETETENGLINFYTQQGKEDEIVTAIKEEKKLFPCLSCLITVFNNLITMSLFFSLWILIRLTRSISTMCHVEARVVENDEKITSSKRERRFKLGECVITPCFCF